MLHAAETVEANKTKRNGMLTKGVRLLQDNTPVHNSHITQAEVLSCGYDILPHLFMLLTLRHLTFTSFRP